MGNFESGTSGVVQANEQLKGFEITGSEDLLNGEYEKIFDNVESKSLEMLFKEFGDVLDAAPEDVRNGVREGNMRFLEAQSEKSGWAREKVKQFLVFALITMNAGPAFSAGKEEVLSDLPRTQVRMGHNVSVNDHGSRVIGMTREQFLKRLQDKNTPQHHVDVRPNTMSNTSSAQGKRVIKDGDRTVILEGPNSEYKVSPDGSTVITGATVIE